MPDVTPLANHDCPLCGQPNQCAPAETGSFASLCWCKTQIFPPDLLGQLNTEQRRESCICQQCVNLGAPAAKTENVNFSHLNSKLE